MKLLHCSDLHLGRRPAGGKGEFSEKRYNDYFNVFNQCVDIAIEEKVDLFIMAGDIFDRKEIVPEVLEKCEKILRRLKESGIFTVAVEGNHDNIMHDKEDESWLNYLAKKGYFFRPTYWFDGEQYRFDAIEFKGYKIYGVGYPGFMVNEILEHLASNIDNSSQNNIVIVHTAIGGGDFLPGLVKKETINLFKDKVTYIAGGHFHSRMAYPEENPYFFLPGSTEYWDLEERRGEKGVIIFNTVSKEYKFIDTEARNKIEIFMSIKSETEEEFRKEFIENIIGNIKDDRESIYIVKIESEKNYYIDSSWCEGVILEKGGLKAIVKPIYKNSIKNSEFGSSGSNIEEIEDLIIKRWELFSSESKIVGQTISKLKIYQQEKMESDFKAQFDLMLNTLIGGGEKKGEN